MRTDRYALILSGPRRKVGRMPTPQPVSRVPFQDHLTDAELGQLLRAAVGIVRDEGGYQRDDAGVEVEVRVTLRAGQ